jgi:uncharacterized protein YoaH (UPF0181 family)
MSVLSSVKKAKSTGEAIEILAKAIDSKKKPAKPAKTKESKPKKAE